MAREAALNPGRRWRAVSAPPGWLTPLSSLIADGHSRGRLRLVPRSCLLRPAVCLPTRRRGRPHPDARATEPHRGSRERTVGGLVPPSAASPLCVYRFSDFSLVPLCRALLAPPLCTSTSTRCKKTRTFWWIGSSRGLMWSASIVSRTRWAGRQPAGTHKKYTQARARYGTHKETNTARGRKNVSVHTQTTVPRTNDRRAHGRTPLPARLLSISVQKRKKQTEPPHTHSPRRNQNEHPNNLSRRACRHDLSFARAVHSCGGAAELAYRARRQHRGAQPPARGTAESLPSTARIYAENCDPHDASSPLEGRTRRDPCVHGASRP